MKTRNLQIKPLLMSLAVLCMASHSTVHAQDSSVMGGRTLVYGQDVKLPQPLHFDPTDKRPLTTILDEALDGTGISYRITQSHILLFVPKAKTYTVYGYVTDKESKESLIGANVYIPLQRSGTSTNEYGYFSLTLPAGETRIETSYVGYERDVQVLDLHSDTLMTISLKLNRELGEVIVDAERPETGLQSSRMSASSISVQKILRMPALLGEPDVIKTLHFEPGVQSTMSGQAGMSVRGGDADQNLFLLDGMMLYNVDHVMGFESAFMPDAVKHVDFFRGSFPARYGGRLSSITDVRTKDGDMQDYHGNFSIGMLSSHLSFEGPLWKDRTSFIISARRTYADWLLNAFKGQLDIDLDRFGLYFYDLNAKVNHRLSDNDRLYLSFYSGRDVIDVDGTTGSDYEGIKTKHHTTSDMHWGNTLYHLRWNHIFTPQLFANVMVGYNRFTLSSLAEYRYNEWLNGNQIADQLTNLCFRSGIDDLTAQIDLDHHPVLDHHLRYGAQYTLHQFRPEVQSSQIRVAQSDAVQTDQTYRTPSTHMFAHEAALYAEDDMNLGERWQLNAGLRAVLFTTEGKTFPALEPRLSTSRVFDGGFRAKASYSMMHQYVHKLTSSQIASPSDLWVPVTKRMKPMSSHQWSIGVGTDRWKGWEIGAETWWKEMYDVIDIIDGASFFGNSKAWETKVTSGRGRSYGIEFYANKTAGRTTGAVNYTLGKSQRWFPDGLINSGRIFPYRYDRRHVVHLVVQHQLTDRIDLNASWNFQSGALVTVAKQQTEYIEPGDNTLSGDYFSQRHNYRMEPTHQLDLGINFHRKTKHGERTWSFSLMNAYCHLNQDMIFATMKDEQKTVGTAPDGRPITETEHHRVLKQITVIPILPSFTYTYKF